MVCPIVDSHEGVTHAMRSSEYHDRDEQYYWLLKAMGLRDVIICDFARLNFEYQLLSKRKLQWFVDNAIVANWDDARFPTIQGMMRRGLTKEALWEFILAEGASKNTVLMEMSKLWAINKRLIDPEVPRYWAVNKTKLVKVTLEDAPATPEAVSKPRHKKNEKLGNKTVTYTNTIYLEQEDAVRLKDGEEVTLMDWGNAIMTKIHRDESGAVTHIDGKLHLAGDFKTTEYKLTWLPALPEQLIDVKLVEFGNLLNKKALAKEDNFVDFVNKDTVFETECLGDPNLRNLQKGDRIQLERRGYYICEQPLFKGSLVLYQIPDGREAALSHIATKKAAPEKKAKKTGK
jgi:glutamyl/glutaminyl-tRNA synthetase